MPDNVLIHLHVVLLLIIIQKSWHHFCTDFPHSQIFQTLFFFMSSWLVIIQTVYRWSLYTIWLICMMLISVSPLLESSFTSLRRSLNLLCHSRTRMNHTVLSSYICSSIWNAWGASPQPDQNLQVYSLFGVHRSFLNVYVAGVISPRNNYDDNTINKGRYAVKQKTPSERERCLRKTKMLICRKNFKILMLQILFRKRNTIFCLCIKDIRLLIENRIKNVSI